VLFTFISCKKGNEKAITDNTVSQEIAKTTEKTAITETTGKTAPTEVKNITDNVVVIDTTNSDSKATETNTSLDEDLVKEMVVEDKQEPIVPPKTDNVVVTDTTNSDSKATETNTSLDEDLVNEMVVEDKQEPIVPPKTDNVVVTDTTNSDSKATETNTSLNEDLVKEMVVEDKQEPIAPPKTEISLGQINTYDFSFMDANVKVTLNNGIATIDYSNNLTKAEIGSGLSYIELILDVNPSDFTFAFSSPGEVMITYPKSISDKDLIEGFKIGLEYYMPYANYDKFNFNLYGMPVYVGIKDGKAIVIYPKNIKEAEVTGLLNMMETKPEAAGFNYTILTDRVVSITYPSTIEENALINGFAALLNDSIPKYLDSLEITSQPLPVEDKVSKPIITENSYQFTLMGAKVLAILDNGKATVKYPENVSNKEVAKGLEYIGNVLKVNSSDFAYNFTVPGEIVVTYPSSYADKDLIEGFRTGLNLYLASMKKVETEVVVKAPITDVKSLDVEVKTPVSAPKLVKDEFVKNYKNFEFYLGDVHVDGMVSEKDVVFKYDSEFFEENFKEQLLKIASAMTAYKTSDFTYDKSEKGRLIVTYSDDIDPNEAIDAFFAVIFYFSFFN